MPFGVSFLRMTKTPLLALLLAAALALGGCPEDPEPDPLPETPRRARV